MIHYRLKNNKRWVLVEAYVAPCGMVAHWCSDEGEHSYEPFIPKLVPEKTYSTP